jgi:ribonuclease P protein component
MNFKFPKKEKLKSKKLIEILFTEGKAVSKYPFKLIYLKTKLTDDVKVQVGVSAPKRNFKRAVDRNRAKRLMRESYRLNKHLIFNSIETSYAFMFLYLGKDIPKNYDEVNKSMVKLMQKFIDNESTEILNK